MFLDLTSKIEKGESWAADKYVVGYEIVDYLKFDQIIGCELRESVEFGVKWKKIIGKYEYLKHPILCGWNLGTSPWNESIKTSSEEITITPCFHSASKPSKVILSFDLIWKRDDLIKDCK